MQPNNPGPLQQQQPYFGAHLVFPRSNLVHQRFGPIDAGSNPDDQGSNLVYGFKNAIHAGSNLVQQSASLAASNPIRFKLAQQRANLGSQQVQMLSENFLYLPN